jgi:hypothetical protein
MRLRRLEERGSVKEAGEQGGTVLWRRPDPPGHESCRLSFADSSWRLEGAAVFAHEGRACRLDYLVTCNSAWQTSEARVAGWVGDRVVDARICADSRRRWRLGGVEIPSVEGCVDVDLNFSPSTNVLPIRRLALEIGSHARVRAAWLRFPGFTLEPLDQVYRRLDRSTYRYESATGFTADLLVDDAGLVIRYPGFCERENRG